MGWSQKTSIWCTLLCLCTVASAMPRPGTADADEAEAKALAEQGNDAVEDILGELSLEDAIPGYTGDMPPEADYFSTEDNAAADLDRAGRRRAATDPHAQHVQQAHAGRPRYPVDPSTDGAMQRAKKIDDAATALGDTTSPGQCQALPTSSEPGSAISTHHCYVYGDQPVIHPSCMRTVEVSCEHGTLKADGCTMDWLPASISADAPCPLCQ